MSKHIAETTLPNGKWVSTVSMQLDMPLSMGRMSDILGYAYETMVFSSKEPPGDALDQRRYQTREEAEQGHAEMVKEWSKP